MKEWKIDEKCGIMTYLELDELESFGTGNLLESLKLLPHGDSETGEVSTKILLGTNFYALMKKQLTPLCVARTFPREHAWQ